MSEQHARLTAAFKTTDFAPTPGCLGGYQVWMVTTIVKGGREEIDGPYFTKEEALIAAERLLVIDRFARADSATHSSSWNPNPAREKAIRDDAMAARMLLAEQIGVDIPRPGAAGAHRR